MPLVLAFAAALRMHSPADTTLARATRDAGRATVTVTDTTWYVTNRSRSAGGLAGVRTDTLEYGFVQTRYRERANASADARNARALDARPVDTVRLSRVEFLARLAEADMRAGARGESPVLYVHGFATSFGRAISQGSEIAYRGRFGGPFVVFSWPAHRAFAAMPRPSALISRAYRDDSASAAASIGAFRGALADLLSVVPANRLTVLGHSLGAQLAAEALYQPSPVHDSLARVPLHALVLFAPDISAPRFRDLLAPALSQVASRRVVYASQHDRLLTMSRLVNHASRVGQAGGEQIVASSDVELVDVTDGRRAANALHNFVEPHHAMRYALSALRDFFGVVRGTPAECRAFQGFAERLGERSWRLTPKAPAPAGPSCASADTLTRTGLPPR